MLNQDLPKYQISDHFIELKARIKKMLIFFLLSWLVSYHFSSDIYSILLQPLKDLISPEQKMIYTDLTEAFFTYMVLSAFAAFIFSIPVILFQIYAFISPGLYEGERNIIKILFIFSPFLFLLAILFVYYFVMPKAWEFFVSFQAEDAAIPLMLEAKISEYLSLVIKLMLAFGIVFQMPILLTILSLLGIISSKALKEKRRIAIICNFIIAGIITPPDILSQICLAIPMVLLYEFSIMSIDYFWRRNARYKMD